MCLQQPLTMSTAQLWVRAEQCCYCCRCVFAAQMSLLPVMAASSGTYHCYLISWCIAARLAEQLFEPLLRHTSGAASHLPDDAHTLEDLQLAAASVMGIHAGLSQQELACKLQTACGLQQSGASPAASGEWLLEDLAAGSVDQLHGDLQRWLWRPE
jgi:hypothetical protein